MEIYIIFANFAQNSASANSKTRENILYAHFGHGRVVYGPCVLMQMGNILKSVLRSALFLCCPVTYIQMYHSLNVNFVQYKNDK